MPKLLRRGAALWHEVHSIPYLRPNKGNAGEERVLDARAARVGFETPLARIAVKVLAEHVPEADALARLLVDLEQDVNTTVEEEEPAARRLRHHHTPVGAMLGVARQHRAHE